MNMKIPKFLLYGEDDPKEIRSVGLRGPLIVGGWAYTLTNRRVPSEEEFGENRNLWKTGPVDLRWDEQRKVYTTLGGTPFLDGNYTVFGEVTKGMEVVDTIAQLARNAADRPNVDVRMLNVRVLRNKFLGIF